MQVSGLARFVRERRLALGLSQKDLAASVGVTSAFISQVESGRRGKKASDDFIEKLAAALQTSVPEIRRASPHLAPTVNMVFERIRNYTPEQRQVILTKIATLCDRYDEYLQSKIKE